jgi:hypothetical protein
MCFNTLTVFHQYSAGHVNAVVEVLMRRLQVDASGGGVPQLAGLNSL